VSADKQQLLLLLGCFGRVDDGFVHCRGCENTILNVDHHLQHYNQMMDYFDSCRLFDKRIYELSAIKHFVYHMQDKFYQSVGRPLWSVKEFTNYEKFIMDHRHCGNYIRLDYKQEDKPIEEKSVFIPSLSSQMSNDLPKVNLKLVRGKFKGNV
jgi:hypothetical protein